VTAVTTAGLLAGLFGSAFVPSVRAADDDATQTFAATSPYASDTTYAYFLTTAYPAFTVTINADSTTDDDGTYSVSVAGGTIRGCSIATSTDNAAAVSFGGVIATSTSCSVSVNVTALSDVAANAGSEAVWTVQLNKLASGDIVTITVADDNTATLASSRKIQGITAAAVSTVDVSSSTSVAAITSGMTENTAKTEWGMTYSATGVIDVNVKNARELLPSPAPLLTASLTGITGMGVYATAADDCTGITGTDANWYVTSDISSTVCVRRIDTADVTAAGLGTLTISAGGKVIKSIAVRVYGDVASMSVTKYASAIAAGAEWGGTSSVDALAKVVYKDSYGTTLPLDTADAGGYDALDDALAFTNAAGTTLTSVDAGDNAGALTAATEVDSYLSFGNTFCTTALAGTTISVTAKATNASSTVVSTSFDVSCTGAAIKITGIAAAKALVTPGEDFWVDLTAVDANGKAAGFGATEIALPAGGLSLSPATGTEATELRDDDGTALAVADFGAGSWGIVDGVGSVKVQAPTAPGTYTMVLTYSDSDATAVGSTETSYTVTVTVRNTNLASKADLTAGPKKKIASADFGPGAAGLKVAFVLEKASGVTKTYYRKANASGVAKYTLGLSGTWTVYATFGDNITETVTLKK
jgi:hypothetical protein